MAVKRRLQKIGGVSLGFTVTKPMQEVLGITSPEDTIIVEEVGNALIVRRDGNEPLTREQLLEILAGEPDVVQLDAPVEEWKQRLLIAVRDCQPAKTVDLAHELGQTRENTSININKLKREGYVARTLAGWELTPSARELFTDGQVQAGMSARDQRFVDALRGLAPATPTEVARHLGVSPNYASRVLVRGARLGWAVKRGGRYELA